MRFGSFDCFISKGQLINFGSMPNGECNCKAEDENDSVVTSPGKARPANRKYLSDRIKDGRKSHSLGCRK